MQLNEMEVGVSINDKSIAKRMFLNQPSFATFENDGCCAKIPETQRNNDLVSLFCY